MRMCTASQHLPCERQGTYILLWSRDADGIGNDQSSHSLFDSLDLAEWKHNLGVSGYLESFQGGSRR
jgi:hypothetical protein